MIIDKKDIEKLTKNEQIADMKFFQYFNSREYNKQPLAHIVDDKCTQLIEENFNNLSDEQSSVISKIQLTCEEFGFINGYIYAVKCIRESLLI